MTARRELLAGAAGLLREAGVAEPRARRRRAAGPRAGHHAVAARAGRRRASRRGVEYDALLARRAAREPLQHLTGVAWFRHVELVVGPGVFVPRPETELLAGWAVEAAGELSEPVVVDLCTGSGAIAKAVADEVPGARVHAVELDQSAYAWAQRNLAGTGVDLRQGDLAAAFDDLAGTVDVVVCNPPYIPLEAWESVAPEARDHDPHLALFSGADGLDAIRVLERRAAQLLRPGGSARGRARRRPGGGGYRRCSPRPAGGPRCATTATWPAVLAS